MKYNIQESADGKRVEVKVCGSVTADLEESFSESAVTFAKQRGILRYFVDVTGVANLVEPFDQYRLAYEEMARFGLDRRSRIAVVHSPSDRSHHFIEILMRNAGYQCRLFEDRREALDWLSEETP